LAASLDTALSNDYFIRHFLSFIKTLIWFFAFNARLEAKRQTGHWIICIGFVASGSDQRWLQHHSLNTHCLVALAEPLRALAFCES
jgi:hypothetical protein